MNRAERTEYFNRLVELREQDRRADPQDRRDPHGIQTIDELLDELGQVDVLAPGMLTVIL